MICRRLGALRKSNTSSDGERKNYCRDDSRFRHHIFLCRSAIDAPVDPLDVEQIEAIESVADGHRA
jgi:hypothetical protein